jgi:hypothetical protein
MYMGSGEKELVEKRRIIHVGEPSTGIGTVKDGQDSRLGRFGLCVYQWKLISTAQSTGAQ